MIYGQIVVMHGLAEILRPHPIILLAELCYFGTIHDLILKVVVDGDLGASPTIRQHVTRAAEKARAIMRIVLVGVLCEARSLLLPALSTYSGRLHGGLTARHLEAALLGAIGTRIPIRGHVQAGFVLGRAYSRLTHVHTIVVIPAVLPGLLGSLLFALLLIILLPLFECLTVLGEIAV